jgi:hypothetical protein
MAEFCELIGDELVLIWKTFERRAGISVRPIRVGVDSRESVAYRWMPRLPLLVGSRPWFDTSSGGSWDWFVVDAVVESEECRDAGTFLI